MAPVRIQEEDVDSTEPFPHPLSRVLRSEAGTNGENGAVIMSRSEQHDPSFKKYDAKQIFRSTEKSRTPRALTVIRKKKIQKFNDLNYSIPGGYLYGEIGTKRWISELIRFLKEPRNHAVNPSDVCGWLRHAPDFFHMERVRTATKVRSSPSTPEPATTSTSSDSLPYDSSLNVESDSGVCRDSVGTNNNSSNNVMKTDGDNPPLLSAALPNGLDLDVPQTKPAQVYWVRTGTEDLWLAVNEETINSEDFNIALEETKEEAMERDVNAENASMEVEASSAIEEKSGGQIVTEFQPNEEQLISASDIKMEPDSETPEPEDQFKFKPVGMLKSVTEIKQEPVEVAANSMALVPVLNLNSSSDFPPLNHTVAYDHQYTARSDLENIPIDLHGALKNIESAGNLHPMLTHLIATNQIVANIDSLQLFTNILLQLINKAKQEGACPQFNLDACFHTMELFRSIIGWTP